MAVALASRPTSAVKTALVEASRRWPNRNRASDGILPSEAHYKRNPNSDHNDGHAFDLTHDPNSGVDCGKIAETLRKNALAGKDGRIKYIIFNRRICSGTYEDKFWTWRPYNGSNPHTAHMHVSINRGTGSDESVWFKSRVPSTTSKYGADYRGRPGTRIIEKWSRGRDVMELQRILNKWYPKLSALKIDGFFGAKTESRVKYLQERAKIKVDGIVGPVTWRTIGVRWRG